MRRSPDHYPRVSTCRDPRLLDDVGGDARAIPRRTKVLDGDGRELPFGMCVCVLSEDLCFLRLGVKSTTVRKPREKPVFFGIPLF